eukprot:TRINITY_DN11272_c0_g1_i2.p1 TRINITY_DN11272_c0_g1~~TRINITY_DN11272_c0_g1_i2.p1  ORF type:complete len:1567 (+),score=315.43 TRINITY_DN11272_c0_g1_i2:138-4703(+)
MAAGAAAAGEAPTAALQCDEERIRATVATAEDQLWLRANSTLAREMGRLRVVTDERQGRELVDGSPPPAVSELLALPAQEALRRWPRLAARVAAFGGVPALAADWGARGSRQHQELRRTLEKFRRVGVFGPTGRDEVPVSLTIKRAAGQALGMNFVHFRDGADDPVVAGVEPLSPAASAGVAEGMWIRSVAGTSVATIDDAISAFGRAGAEFKLVATQEGPQRAPPPGSWRAVTDELKSNHDAQRHWIEARIAAVVRLLGTEQQARAALEKAAQQERPSDRPAAAVAPGAAETPADTAAEWGVTGLPSAAAARGPDRPLTTFLSEVPTPQGLPQRAEWTAVDAAGRCVAVAVKSPHSAPDIYYFDPLDSGAKLHHKPTNLFCQPHEVVLWLRLSPRLTACAFATSLSRVCVFTTGIDAHGDIGQGPPAVSRSPPRAANMFVQYRLKDDARVTGLCWGFQGIYAADQLGRVWNFDYKSRFDSRLVVDCRDEVVQLSSNFGLAIPPGCDDDRPLIAAATLRRTVVVRTRPNEQGDLAIASLGRADHYYKGLAPCGVCFAQQDGRSRVVVALTGSTLLVSVPPRGLGDHSDGLAVEAERSVAAAGLLGPLGNTGGVVSFRAANGCATAVNIANTSGSGVSQHIDAVTAVSFARDGAYFVQRFGGTGAVQRIILLHTSAGEHERLVAAKVAASAAASLSTSRLARPAVVAAVEGATAAAVAAATAASGAVEALPAGSPRPRRKISAGGCTSVAPAADEGGAVRCQVLRPPKTAAAPQRVKIQRGGSEQQPQGPDGLYPSFHCDTSELAQEQVPLYSPRWQPLSRRHYTCPTPFVAPDLRADDSPCTPTLPSLPALFRANMPPLSGVGVQCPTCHRAELTTFPPLKDAHTRGWCDGCSRAYNRNSNVLGFLHCLPCNWDICPSCRWSMRAEASAERREADAQAARALLRQLQGAHGAVAAALVCAVLVWRRSPQQRRLSAAAGACAAAALVAGCAAAREREGPVLARSVLTAIIEDAMEMAAAPGSPPRLQSPNAERRAAAAAAAQRAAEAAAAARAARRAAAAVPRRHCPRPGPPPPSAATEVAALLAGEPPSQRAKPAQWAGLCPCCHQCALLAVPAQLAEEAPPEATVRCHYCKREVPVRQAAASGVRVCLRGLCGRLGRGALCSGCGHILERPGWGRVACGGVTVVSRPTDTSRHQGPDPRGLAAPEAAARLPQDTLVLADRVDGTQLCHIVWPVEGWAPTCTRMPPGGPRARERHELRPARPHLPRLVSTLLTPRESATEAAPCAALLLAVVVTSLSHIRARLYLSYRWAVIGVTDATADTLGQDAAVGHAAAQLPGLQQFRMALQLQCGAVGQRRSEVIYRRLGPLWRRQAAAVGALVREAGWQEVVEFQRRCGDPDAEDDDWQGDALHEKDPPRWALPGSRAAALVHPQRLRDVLPDPGVVWKTAWRAGDWEYLVRLPEATSVHVACWVPGSADGTDTAQLRRRLWRRRYAPLCFEQRYEQLVERQTAEVNQVVCAFLR